MKTKLAITLGLLAGFEAAATKQSDNEFALLSTMREIKTINEVDLVLVHNRSDAKLKNVIIRASLANSLVLKGLYTEKNAAAYVLTLNENQAYELREFLIESDSTMANAAGVPTTIRGN